MQLCYHVVVLVTNLKVALLQEINIIYFLIEVKYCGVFSPYLAPEVYKKLFYDLTGDVEAVMIVWVGKKGTKSVSNLVYHYFDDLILQLWRHFFIKFTLYERYEVKEHLLLVHQLEMLNYFEI